MTNSIEAQPSIQQVVRWGPPDGDPAGIRAFDESLPTYTFIPWAELLPELEHRLLPQLFANPRGYSFATKDYHDKTDWLVQVVNGKGEYYCDVWFGNNPEKGYVFDGLVRVGLADDGIPVWQTYERRSDATYHCLFSRCATIDEMKR